MTKDQIIEKQSKMIRDLISIGMNRYQEIMDLFVEIEKHRGVKEEEIEKIGIIDNHSLNPKIVPINKKVKLPDTQELDTEKKGKLCPRCKKNNRLITKSGRLLAYCTACNTAKARERRAKKGINKNDLAIAKAFEM